MSKKQNGTIMWIMSIVIILGVVIGLLTMSANKPGKYDAFAQCLANNGATFYGAYWCPHCQATKALFGRSAKKLPYVECAFTGRDGQTLAKEIIPQYKAGTYTGVYKTELDQAQASGTLDTWVPSQTQACVPHNIEGYPTWIFADGSRLSGEVSMETLSEKTNCAIAQ